MDNMNNKDITTLKSLLTGETDQYIEEFTMLLNTISSAVELGYRPSVKFTATTCKVYYHYDTGIFKYFEITQLDEIVRWIDQNIMLLYNQKVDKTNEQI